MLDLFITLWSDDRGQDAAEYSLLIVLISLAIVVAATNLGSGVDLKITQAADHMTNATSGN